LVRRLDLFSLDVICVWLGLASLGPTNEIFLYWHRKHGGFINNTFSLRKQNSVSGHARFVDNDLRDHVSL